MNNLHVLIWSFLRILSRGKTMKSDSTMFSKNAWQFTENNQVKTVLSYCAYVLKGYDIKESLKLSRWIETSRIILCVSPSVVVEEKERRYKVDLAKKSAIVCSELIHRTLYVMLFDDIKDFRLTKMTSATYWHLQAPYIKRQTKNCQTVFEIERQSNHFDRRICFLIS